MLQSSLLAQHRFDEALGTRDVAARDAEPDNAALRAAVGEIQMELGQYDSARVSFAGCTQPLGDLASRAAPRALGGDRGAVRIRRAGCCTPRSPPRSGSPPCRASSSRGI